MDERAIIAAVDKLNEDLKTLPEWVPCSIDGLYPEFDYEPFGPHVYLRLLEQEMKDADKILKAHPDEQIVVERLITMLMQCAIALRQAGVK
jgi:hypothetical protein